MTKLPLPSPVVNYIRSLLPAPLPISVGLGVPTSPAQAGYIFIRIDSAASAGHRIYVSQGGGTWNAIAGV